MLSIAIVGAGRVSELHAKAIAGARGMRIAGVYDSNGQRSGARAAEWDCDLYPTLNDALADDNVDAVWVLTPAQSHLSTARAALEAGKHVLVEKPVDGDAAAVTALADFARARDLVALPGHNYLHLPEARRLVRQVSSGSLGEVRALFVTYAMCHPEILASRYGPVLTELMIHHAYIAIAALGAPTRVAAGASRPGWDRLTTSDQAWMTWEYDGRGPTTTVHLFASFAVDDQGADPQTFAVKALGTEATAGFSWRACTRRASGDGIAVGLPLYEETYEHEAAAFRDVVAGLELPVSDMYAAALAARVLAAAEQAATNHCTITVHPAIEPPQAENS